MDQDASMDTLFFAFTSSMLIESMILVGAIFVVGAWGQIVGARFKGADKTVPTALYPFTLSVMVFPALLGWLVSRPKFGGPSTELRDGVSFVSFVCSFVLLIVTTHFLRRNGGRPKIVATGCKALLAITSIYLFLFVLASW